MMYITRSRVPAEESKYEARSGPPTVTQEESVIKKNLIAPRNEKRISESKKTTKAKRIRNARLEILRIRLELAQLALEKDESDSSESEEENKSKTDHVRSRVENSAHTVTESSSPTQCADVLRQPLPIPSYNIVPQCPSIVTESENEKSWEEIDPVQKTEVPIVAMLPPSSSKKTPKIEQQKQEKEIVDNVWTPPTYVKSIPVRVLKPAGEPSKYSTHRYLHYSSADIIVKEFLQHSWKFRRRPINRNTDHRRLNSNRKAQPQESSKRHWRWSLLFADMLWRRRNRKYLPELQYRREPHDWGPAYQVGDPVLIRGQFLKIPTETLVPLSKIEDVVAHRG